MWSWLVSCLFFFFNDTATTEIYTYGHTLSLHDALPICREVDDAAHQALGYCFHPVGAALRGLLRRAGCRSGRSDIVAFAAWTSCASSRRHQGAGTTDARVACDACAGSGKIGRASCRERVCQYG